jgi:putative sterol carrier protein
VVTAASITTRAEAEPPATFLLAGSLEDWTDLLEGFDPGKTIMYRKLLLEKGETLQFFMAAFFWTELLAAIRSVPTEVPALA